MIVVESGAHWPSWMSDTVGKSPRRVLAQLDGEDCAAFAERVARGGKVPGELVALVCNQRADGRQMDARRRALANRSARAWLVVGPNTRDELLEQLVRLVSELPDTELRAGSASPLPPSERAPLSSVA